MFQRFALRPRQMVLAVTLMVLGAATVLYLSQFSLKIADKDITSIGLLVGGLVFYSGVLVIIAMFENETVLGIGIILPSIVAIAIFVYGFIGWSFRVSMSHWTGLLPDFSAFDFLNYVNLLTKDPRFAIDIRNTLAFTVLFISGCLVIGLGLAILLDQRLKGEAIFRGIFLFPMSISFIASGVVWGWLMSPAPGDRTTGINLIFKTLGLNFLISTWHSSPAQTVSLLGITQVTIPWGMMYTAIPAIWQLSGFAMALYLGGIRSIPEDLREAARVDGASEFQIYRHIILPLLRPVTLSAVIILGHMSLKIFDLIVAIGSGNLSLDVPGIYMWRTTFDATKYGEGATIGILMLVSVALLVIPYLVYSMRSEAEL